MSDWGYTRLPDVIDQDSIWRPDGSLNMTTLPVWVSPQSLRSPQLPEKSVSLNKVRDKSTIYNILICITLNNKIPVNITKSAPVVIGGTKWSWFEEKRSEELTQADVWNDK